MGDTCFSACRTESRDGGCSELETTMRSNLARPIRCGECRGGHWRVRPRNVSLQLHHTELRKTRSSSKRSHSKGIGKQRSGKDYSPVHFCRTVVACVRIRWKSSRHGDPWSLRT